MPGPAVLTQRLSKTYRVYARPADRLREALTGRVLHAPVPALADVSFEVSPGSALGIVGDNGAGKSTLLKILTGTTRPTSGTASVTGRIASILELGAAFHHDFSGRENARMNASFLGFSAPEIEGRLPAVQEFAELGEFFDRPVRTYSSGMAMRLAFAVATTLDPDVLIVDEALAVGDGHFQKKCVDRIVEFRRKGVTILFCSHALYTVSMLCDRTLWLERGRLVQIGPTADVVHAYERALAERERTEARRDPATHSGGRLTSLRVLDGEGREKTVFAPEEPLTIEATLEADSAGRPFHLMVGIETADHIQCFAYDTNRDGVSPLFGSTRYVVRFDVPALPFSKGSFLVHAIAGDDHALHVYDVRVGAPFVVETPDVRFGLVHVPHRWRWEPAENVEEDPS